MTVKKMSERWKVKSGRLGEMCSHPSESCSTPVTIYPTACTRVQKRGYHVELQNQSEGGECYVEMVLNILCNQRDVAHS